MRSGALFLLLSFLSFSAFAEIEMDKILGLMKTLPKVSKAIIKRGKTEIPVDLSQPSAKSQIKDYDVLLLQEGVYSTLGNFTAKYVRVRGQGPRKTILTSLETNSSPILVNSTEFWDTSIADAKFKIVDVNGFWAVNVNFAGAILVKPAAEDRPPVFAVRSIFSYLTNAKILTTNKSLTTNLNIESNSPAGLLAFEDKLDRSDAMNMKERMAQKGLIARAANYLYQVKGEKPRYNQVKYYELTKQARTAKSKGHYYVSMLTWAEADRLSGHARFDEVIKEITPLQQNLNKECGCTIEGHGLASTARNEIEEKLYAKIPAASLPGPCKIQTLKVTPSQDLASARLEAQLARTATYRAHEDAFESSVIAHSGKNGPSEDDFVVGAAMVETKTPDKNSATVADVEMPGFSKTIKGDANDIVEPIANAYNERFEAEIKEAHEKTKSKDVFSKIEGFIVATLFGSDREKQIEYESLHEQQFGRKASSRGALSSVYAY